MLLRLRRRLRAAGIKATGVNRLIVSDDIGATTNALLEFRLKLIICAPMVLDVQVESMVDGTATLCRKVKL